MAVAMRMAFHVECGCGGALLMAVKPPARGVLLMAVKPPDRGASLMAVKPACGAPLMGVKPVCGTPLMDVKPRRVGGGISSADEAAVACRAPRLLLLWL